MIVSVATMSAITANATRNTRERVEECRVDVGNAFLCELCAGDRLHARWELRSDAIAQQRAGHARLALHVDGGDLVGRAGHQLLRGRQCERCPCGRTETVGRSERGDADDVHADGVGNLHGRRVTEVQVAGLGGTAVDDDLVGRARGVWPATSRYGLTRGVVDPAAGLPRRSVAADALAVGAEQCAVADDLALGVGDARYRAPAAVSSDSSMRPTSESGAPPFFTSVALRTTTLVCADASVNRVVKLWRSVSPTTSVPVRNATPRATATQMLARRRRRPQADPRVRRIISGPECAHAVEDAVGRGRDHLVDDSSVRQEHDAVRVGRGRGVMGDHHDRLAEYVDGSAEEAQHLTACV